MWKNFRGEQMKQDKKLVVIFHGVGEIKVEELEKPSLPQVVLIVKVKFTDF